MEEDKFSKKLDPKAPEFRPSNQNPTLRGSLLQPYLYNNYSYINMPPLLPPPSPVPTRTLILISVPRDATESSVRAEMGAFGEVRKIEMERLHEGIVTVHYFDLRHAEAAITQIRAPPRASSTQVARNVLIGSGTIWAQYVTATMEEMNEQGTLVISGLDYRLSPIMLKEIVEDFGPVREVRRVSLKLNETEWFVEFFDGRDARKAVSQLDGKELVQGKHVKIEFSRPNTALGPTEAAFLPPYGFTFQPFQPFFGGGFSGTLRKQIRSRPWKGEEWTQEERDALIIKDVKDVSEIKDGRTTLMIRNIPNKYSRALIINMLDNHCLRCNENIKSDDQPLSSYNFLYLPIDFNNRCNVGYGFINMTSPEAAWRFYRAFHLHQWEVLNSYKICHVSYARLQGLEALKAHFQTSRFACIKDEYMPVVFLPPRDGGDHLTWPIPITTICTTPNSNAINDDESKVSADVENVDIGDHEIGSLSLEDCGVVS